MNTNKMSLEQFKANLNDSKQSMEMISGEILGACHDEVAVEEPNWWHSFLRFITFGGYR